MQGENISSGLHHQLSLDRAKQLLAKTAEAQPYARRAVNIFTRLVSPSLQSARATLRECES